MVNVSKQYNFVTTTLNQKIKEIIKSEACFPTISLKKGKNKESSILELKIQPPTSITNSKQATPKEESNLQASSTDNLLDCSKFYKKKQDLSMNSQDSWPIDFYKKYNFQKIWSWVRSSPLRRVLLRRFRRNVESHRSKSWSKTSKIFKKVSTLTTESRTG